MYSLDINKNSSIDIFSNWTSNKEIILDSDGRHVLPELSKFPLDIKCYNFPWSYRLIHSYHDFFEIMYIFQGDGNFYIENKPYNVRVGDVCIIGSNRLHLLEALPQKETKIISIFFTPETIYHFGLDNLAFEYLHPFYIHDFQALNVIPAHTQQSLMIFNLIKEMYMEFLNRKKYYQLAIKNLLCTILLIIARYYSNLKSFDKNLICEMNVVHRLKNVFSFIQNHFDEHITNLQLSKIASMSPAYLCRFFKKATGMTLSDYILRCRIEKAKELLILDDLSVSQIAFQVGFESLNYFDRVFKKLVYSTPQEFRQSYLLQSY